MNINTIIRPRRALCAAAVVLAAALAAPDASGVNPILPLWEYIPDGEPYVFEDPDNPGRYRVYLYGSHDNLVSEYCGRDQVVWSAPVDDLGNWRCDGIIFESRRDANGRLLYANGQSDVLYAPDVAERINPDGTKTYYLYPNNQAGPRNGMVARSSRPDGPFEVCNWSDTDPAAAKGDLRFDPAVIIDGDKVYGYWGFIESYGAELDPADMASVRPGTKAVKDLIPGRDQDTTFRFFEASSMRKIKDKYVLVYSRWTNDGEFGLPASNYTLAYAYSDSPLGPFTYGGTLIDGRARRTMPDGSTIATATPGGNTHGSIIDINGQWYVFYHRQTGTDEFSRQAMVAPIEVSVTEGPGGKVEISEGEYTSEGFEIGGLDPFERHSAGIACYYTGPRPATASFPNFYFSGSYIEPQRPKIEAFHTPYDPRINHAPVVNNTAGSTVGYKYFNLDKLAGRDNAALIVNLMPLGIDADIRVMLDDPTTGTQIGSINLTPDMPRQAADIKVPVTVPRHLTGKHALYFVVDSDTPDKSVCTLNNFLFTAP